MAWWNDITPSDPQWNAIRSTSPGANAMEGSLAPLFRGVHPMLGGMAPASGPHNTQPVKWGLPLTAQQFARRTGVPVVAVDQLQEVVGNGGGAGGGSEDNLNGPFFLGATLEGGIDQVVDQSYRQTAAGVDVYRVSIPNKLTEPVTIRTGLNETVIVDVVGRAQITVRELSDVTIPAWGVPPPPEPGFLGRTLRDLYRRIMGIDPPADVPNAISSPRG